ncbi:hypothetical protein WISP_19226 [Willisornis vidua]|uniref:Uncharacterized protein n=1 Tax=Willisornis vidua TaxID=1566151 RepID=A0ABQ9DNU1_9PASS|nr:hypothetical protein WISP_19226 [Willisornis vidua]
MPVGYRMDPPLAKTESTSDSDSASGIRKREKLRIFGPQVGEPGDAEIAEVIYFMKDLYMCEGMKSLNDEKKQR